MGKVQSSLEWSEFLPFPSASLGSLRPAVVGSGDCGHRRLNGPLPFPGLSLQWQGDWLVLSGGLGVVVRLDRSSSVSISVAHELLGQTQGLCGLYSGRPEGTQGVARQLVQGGGGTGPSPAPSTSAPPFLR